MLVVQQTHSRGICYATLVSVHTSLSGQITGFINRQIISPPGPRDAWSLSTAALWLTATTFPCDENLENEAPRLFLRRPGEILGIPTLMVGYCCHRWASASTDSTLIQTNKHLQLRGVRLMRPFVFHNGRPRLQETTNIEADWRVDKDIT